MPVFQADGTFSSGVGVGAVPPNSPTSSFEKPTIAIMSLGEMGMGVATLFYKYSYSVITNLEGRSEITEARAEAIGVQVLSFNEMLEEATILLSFVPPAEAYSLAKMAATIVQTFKNQKCSVVSMGLNAISPAISREFADVVNTVGMTFIDGAILGFPPRELADNT
jgi:3-hydroxyisobutyrate dehydrogenase-like beta-hydroxyacid dehydrogenase